jgi:hypothetical protein
MVKVCPRRPAMVVGSHLFGHLSRTNATSAYETDSSSSCAVMYCINWRVVVFVVCVSCRLTCSGGSGQSPRQVESVSQGRSTEQSSAEQSRAEPSAEANLTHRHTCHQLRTRVFNSPRPLPERRPSRVPPSAVPSSPFSLSLSLSLPWASPAASCVVQPRQMCAIISDGRANNSHNGKMEQVSSVANMGQRRPFAPPLPAACPSAQFPLFRLWIGFFLCASGERVAGDGHQRGK